MKTLILNLTVGLIVFGVLFFSNHSVLAGEDSGAVLKGEKITIRVDGLSCPFCAYGLEKKLKSLEGVKKIEIKVNDGLVFLYLKKGAEIREALLRKKVEEAGFTPREITVDQSPLASDSPAQKVTLKIQGMTCEGCVSVIEQALNKVGCARDIAVNLEKNEATLTCTADEDHRKQLVKAVEEAGFKAEIVNDSRN